MMRSGMTTLLLLASTLLFPLGKAEAQPPNYTWNYLPEMTAIGPTTLLTVKQNTYFSYAMSVTDTDTMLNNGVIVGTYFDSDAGLTTPIAIRSFKPTPTLTRSGSSGNTSNFLISGTSKVVTEDTTFVDDHQAYNSAHAIVDRRDASTAFQVQVRVTLM